LRNILTHHSADDETDLSEDKTIRTPLRQRTLEKYGKMSID